jgi:hypothetical protein
MSKRASIASKRRKQKAYEDTGCQDAGTLPKIGISALLKLAEWIGQKRAEAAHGGETCDPISDQNPPVPGQSKAKSAIESTVAGTAHSDAKTRSAKTPAPHRKATARTTHRRGGGA